MEPKSFSFSFLQETKRCSKRDMRKAPFSDESVLVYFANQLQMKVTAGN
jgi:hypothetical protein